MIGDGDKVAIGFCDPGEVDGSFAVSLAGTVWSALGQHISQIIRVHGGQIPKLRNLIATRFLESDAQWLFMIDTDEKFSPVQFATMLETVDERDCPVLSGIIFGELSGGDSPMIEPRPLIYRKLPNGLYAHYDDYPDNALIDVDACSAGFLVVHRSVLERIQQSHDDASKDWCWFQEHPRAGEWLGEDFYFCERALEAGFPVRALTSVVVDHHKHVWLDEAWRVPPE